MFSVSPAELVTIAVVALLVFGPDRLPEVMRKIGKVGREVNRAAQELKEGIEREIGDARSPLDDVRRQLGATIAEPAEPETPPEQDGEADPDAADDTDDAESGTES